MALTSLQVCMDSPDWIIQGTLNEENEIESSSPSSGEILMCSRPLIERRLRPPHDQPMKCPRCDSAHTKFCYYNNYSLTQPRYFCKTCRRYWTKGGTLRNIPVGGGCRKNKKPSTSKKSSHLNNAYPSLITHVLPGPSSSTDLHLSSPEARFSHLNNLLDGSYGTSFMDSKFNTFLGLSNPRPLDHFMKNQNQTHPVYSASREGPGNQTSTISHNFMGNGDHLGIMSSNSTLTDHFQTFQENVGTTFNSTPYGMCLDGNSNNGGAYLDTCGRLMHPYNYQGDEDQGGGIEVKPNTKLLALEWQQDQSSCADQVSGKDNHQTFGYLDAGLGSWTGLITGYGSSATNALV